MQDHERRLEVAGTHASRLKGRCDLSCPRLLDAVTERLWPIAERAGSPDAPPRSKSLRDLFLAGVEPVNLGKLSCLGVVLLLLAGCKPPEPQCGQPTMQGQSMQRMLATVNTIGAFSRGETSQAVAEQAATELVNWSGRMGELFPPNEAAQYVDLTPEMARSAPATMLRTSERLLPRWCGREIVKLLVSSSRQPNATAAVQCHRRPYR